MKIDSHLPTSNTKQPRVNIKWIVIFSVFSMLVIVAGTFIALNSYNSSPSPNKPVLSHNQKSQSAIPQNFVQVLINESQNLSQAESKFESISNHQ